MDDSNVVKLHKATIYIVDHDQVYDGIDELLENELMGFGVAVFDDDTAFVRWDDDIDINFASATKEQHEKYFRVNEMTLEEVEKALGYKVKIIG